jgi:hypothetical protein
MKRHIAKPALSWEYLESRQLLSRAPAIPLATAASDAYIYGLAPVLAYYTERINTNVVSPNSNGQAPINLFANVATFPNPSYTVIVRPNADTLYSTAWLDLSKGPIVLSYPNTGGRYFLFQLLDAFTNTFASLGARTDGTAAKSFLIAGPNWKGKVPAGLTLEKAPTNTVWVIGRTETLDTPKDIAAVNKLQAQYKLTPLADWKDPNYKPPAGKIDPTVDTTHTPTQQALALDGEQFFTLLAKLLRRNPPLKQDATIVKELAELGIGPADQFNWNRLSKAQQTAITDAVAERTSTGLPTRVANDIAHNVGVSQVSNGWTERLDPTEIGAYSTHYDSRAVIAIGGIGANLPQDAIYPSTSVDSNGVALNSGTNYVLHFDKSQLPPAGAFWSLTVYNQSGYFVSNPINRYSTGSLHPELTYNADGSLDIYLQPTNPGGSKTSNWLPTPATPSPFNLALRLYEPSAAALNGTWTPPRVYSTQQLALNNAATQAYEYGYPLVLQTLSEQIATDVSKVSGSQAPVNQLANLTLAPLSAGYGPNADTLYSFGWLDLSKEPVVLHVPNTNGRFYSFELIDAWTNAFTVIGERTTGTAEGDYAIVGPNWTGTLPAGVTKVQSPTDLVQFIGRTLVYGQSDVPAATAIQQQYSLTPLSDFGTAYTPPTNVPTNPKVDTIDSASAQIAKLSGQQFFRLLAQSLIDNPPLAGDTATALKNLAAIGITPGQSLNLSKLSAGQLAALNAAGGSGSQLVASDAKTYPTKGVVENGWTLPPADVSNYGTNYADRAGAAEDGYTGTNLQADAIYPGTNFDVNGAQLDGSKSNYTITFPAGQLPPAQAFWSLTLYQYDGKLADLKLYPNAENVYEIGNRSNYKLNADGSLTIYIQNQSPGTDKAANWLPAPTGPFQLTLRLYTPDASALNGQWQPPAVISSQQAALNADAVNAYEYAYPLLVQYYTERQQTNVTAPHGDKSLAPVNQLFNNALAPLGNSTGPNADTLYTGGWLDLSAEPIVLHVPNFNGRFYSFEFGDAWTNTFAIIGRSTTGTAAGNYAILGPNWNGTLPAGITGSYRSPTNLVDFLGRTLVYGSSDLSTADSYRQQFTLTPLSHFGSSYTPPVGTVDPALCR